MLHLLIALVIAQDAPPNTLPEARTRAVAEVGKFREKMAKLGAKAEAGDCDSILAKVQKPSQPMPEAGGAGVHPGDDKYEEILKEWSEFGKKMAWIYNGALQQERDANAKEASLFSSWFGTFEEIAKGVRRLNKRRVASKLAPVTADWSGSFGGYMHSLYMQSNRTNSAATSGPAKHTQDKKLSDYSEEGLRAALGAMGSGDIEQVIDEFVYSRYRRKPAMDPKCSRVALGGMRDNWWCLYSAGTSSAKPPDVITIPGDGAVDVPVAFEKDDPIPFPKGVTTCGTLIAFDFATGAPKNATLKLFDAEGKEVPSIMIDAKSFCFAAKDPLASTTKYVARLEGAENYKLEISFTTK